MAKVQVGQSESTGEFFVKLPGGVVQPVTPEQAQQIQSDPGTVSNLIGSAAGATKELLLGGASLFLPGESDRALAKQQLVPAQQQQAARAMQSPISTMAGGAVPYIAADAAALAAGGLPAVALTGALTGAAGSPEEPFAGAAIGGALGAIPMAAGPAVRAAGNVMPSMGALGESLRTAAGVIPGVNARMTDRVMARLNRVDEGTTPKGPILHGYMTPEELQGAGIPYTRGDAAALMSRTPDEMTNATTIRNMEELQRAGPLGATTNAIRDQQKTGFTQYIKKELGIDANDARALTDTRMGEVFQGLGKQFDSIAENAGPQIKMGSSFKDDLTALVDNAEPDYQARLAKVVENTFTRLDETGAMTQRGMKSLEGELGRMMDTAINHGNYALISDITYIRNSIREAVEKQLPEQMKGQMQTLRKQYALASSLVRKGVRDPAGEINAASLRNSWNLNPNYSKKQIGQQDLGRALETAAFLTSRVVPSSGTTERLMANAPNAVLKAAPGVAMTALGAKAVFGN